MKNKSNPNKSVTAILVLFLFVVFAKSIFANLSFDETYPFIPTAKNRVVEDNKTKNDGTSRTSEDLEKTKTAYTYDDEESNAITVKKQRSQETQDYFEEIVMNTEWNGKRETAYKWEKDVKIYISGEKTAALLAEINTIVQDLNKIINSINIEVVTNYDEANLYVFLGPYQDYAANNPSIDIDRLVHNFGYFTVFGNYGKMYVDTHRANEIEQFHLLREELTQSLGLFNDSYEYPESIFYQGWTTTTEFASIDIELIDMLYND